jgi:small-conductance mechanosensitive channel
MENWVEVVKNKLEIWLSGFFKLIPNIALAVLVVVFFYFLAKFLRKISYKLFLKISGKTSLSSLFASILFIIAICIGAIGALQLLHLEKTISSLLAGAGIVGLALGFAFQDLTANFISGVFIIFRKPFEVGQIVDTNGFIGTIEEIQLRSTTIRTYQGLHILLPNKDIFQKPITNYSLSEKRRADIVLMLPAKTDINQLEQIIRNSLTGLPDLDKDKDIEIFFTDYTGDNIKLEVRCWINNKEPKVFSKIRSDIIKQIHEAIIRQQPAS